MVWLLALIGLILVLMGILLVRYAIYGQKPVPIAPGESFRLDGEAYDRLGHALSFRTLSFDDQAKQDYQPFYAFRDWLKRAFPFIQDPMELETVNEMGLLLKWEGSDTEAAPILLLAHYDVVPAEPENEWRYGPFEGIRAEGYVWGRGALDDKVSVMGILEALNQLMEEGFRPQRPVYIAFGFDEEIGGQQGAAVLADYLEKQGVQPKLILDEGMAVTEGLVPGIDHPVGLVGIAEKGQLNVALKARAEGGHASMPGHNVIGHLSKAVNRLEKRPMPPKLAEPQKAMFQYIAPYSGFFQRLILANQWLFSPLITRLFSQTESGNASIRTTIAPTISRAGSKRNTIPSEGNINLNVRLLPGDTEGQLFHYLEQQLKDLPVEAEKVDEGNPPSPVAGLDETSFAIVQQAVNKAFPEAIVAPSLVLGATDSRHYSRLTPNIYRFSPIHLDSSLLATIHGTDERIGEADYQRVVNFYRHFIRSATVQ